MSKAKQILDVTKDEQAKSKVNFLKLQDDIVLTVGKHIKGLGPKELMPSVNEFMAKLKKIV